MLGVKRLRAALNMDDIVICYTETPTACGYTSVINMINMAMVNPHRVIRRVASAYQIYHPILIEYC